jgi:hypothetical protein
VPKHAKFTPQTFYRFAFTFFFFFSALYLLQSFQHHMILMHCFCPLIFALEPPSVHGFCIMALTPSEHERSVAFFTTIIASIQNYSNFPP